MKEFFQIVNFVNIFKMLVFWGSLVISQRVLVTYENIFMKTERRGGREGWKEEESVNST